MKYTIDYYSPDVKQEILSLPVTLQARYIRCTQKMIVYGANIGEPHSKSLGKGLFELRLKGMEGIARVFYCTLVGQKIVMLHSFVKKTQKIPQKEITIAISRMKEVKNDSQT